MPGCDLDTKKIPIDLTECATFSSSNISRTTNGTETIDLITKDAASSNTQEMPGMKRKIDLTKDVSLPARKISRNNNGTPTIDLTSDDKDMKPFPSVFSSEFIEQTLCDLQSKLSTLLGESQSLTLQSGTLLRIMHDDRADVNLKCEDKVYESTKPDFISQYDNHVKQLEDYICESNDVLYKIKYLKMLQENDKLNPNSVYHFDFYNNNCDELMKDYELIEEYKYDDFSIKVLLNKALPSFVICLTIDSKEYFIAGSSTGNSFDQFDKNALFSILHSSFGMKNIRFQHNQLPVVKMHSTCSEFEIFIFCHENQLYFYKKTLLLKILDQNSNLLD